MDALTFFGLEPTTNPTSWRLTVVPSLISGTGALFGGCGLGAAIEVMEQVTGRPCIWATAQFLSFARPPSELELLEGQIAGVEAKIAELERTLADDWTNMDVLGAHRAARDELVRLLERWEVLFAEAPAT